MPLKRQTSQHRLKFLKFAITALAALSGLLAGRIGMAQYASTTPVETPAILIAIPSDSAPSEIRNLQSEISSAPATFAAANQEFTAGNYAAALAQYESLMARGWASPALFFNAGNAAAQLNRKALAVLYYERALVLAPRDSNIQYNQRLVAPPDNFQPVFFLFRPFWFVRHQLRPAELFALAAGFYILGNLALALAFALRGAGPRRAGRWTGAVALLLALYFGGTIYAIQHEQRTAPLNIVMQPATARSGPGENFKSLLELPEGLKVHDKGPAGPGWREIQLLTGQTAYLPASALTPITS